MIGDTDDPNPYRSPSGDEAPPAARRRVGALVLGIVLVNVVLNARDAIRNWPELTLWHHLVGVTLWLLLPLLAMLLLTRGKALGRWVLVALFGLRALGGLEFLFGQPVVLTSHPSLLLTEPLRTIIVETLFYTAATAWLICSPSLRRVTRHRGNGPRGG